MIACTFNHTSQSHYIRRTLRAKLISLFHQQDEAASDEPEETQSQSDEPEVIFEGPSPAKVQKTEYQRLRKHLEEKKTHNEKTNESLDPATTVQDMIERDMESYETSGKRPPGLEQLYSALLSIPPTSAEVSVALHCAKFLAKPIRELTWSNIIFILSF